MPQHLPPPSDPDEPAEPTETDPDEATAPDDEPAGRTIRVRLNPNLRDSPLRRALAAASLRAPFNLHRTRRRDDGTQEK